MEFFENPGLDNIQVNIVDSCSIFVQRFVDHFIPIG